MSIIALKFFPEKERKLSRYQDMLERFFLENFPHSIDELSYKLNVNITGYIVLIDRNGKIDKDFLCIIMAWMNIASKYKNEFHEQLRLCFQEQISTHPIIMSHGKISLMNGQIIFSSLSEMIQEEEIGRLMQTRTMVSETVE